MFKRLAAISGAEERTEIFSLLMVGFGLMGLILAAMALIIGAMAVRELPFLRAANTWEAILVMALLLALTRWPILLAKSQVRWAFGLDVRTFRARFGALFPVELAKFTLFFFVSWGLVTLYSQMGLVVWASLVFLIIQLLVWAPFVYHRLRPRLFPADFREANPVELPDNLAKIVKNLPLPKNWDFQRILVDSRPVKGLPWPYLLGQTLIIPQKALTMPEGALRHRIITAILGSLVKAEGLVMILKALTMSLAAPLVLVVLGAVGFMWRSPQFFAPLLAPCLWLATGISFIIAQAIVRFTRRLLERKLSSAAVLATWDAPGFKASLEMASRWDLEPDKSPWWFCLSRTRPGAIEQIERVKEQLRSLSKLPQPARETPANRPRSFDTDDQERANA
ncbi:MAG: hypothetical protein LBT86_05565 [Deltaproteobacteria bacterium]|jgi:hypothetical protein|nr:hypothetical protein [Deltaproteobacteria bacterium]